MNRMKKGNMFYHVISLLLIVIFISSLFTSSVKAQSELENVPYGSYTFLQDGSKNSEVIPIRSLFEFSKQIKIEDLNTQNLKEPRYIYTSNNSLFVMDSGNGRILEIDVTDYKLKREWNTIKNGSEEYTFEGARGIYQAPNRKIYIADTMNHRIIIVNEDLSFSGLINSPTGFGVPDDFVFSPSRIQMDKNGYLYVVSEGCFYGLIVFSQSNEFMCFYGANSVTSNLFEGIKNKISSIFKTNSKAEGSLLKLPSEIIDISLDNEGNIYTLSSDDTGQIKRLSMKGLNTLIYKQSFINQSADSFDFREFPFEYWHNQAKYPEIFSGIATDNQGYTYIVDSGRGKIYMYDSECQLLCVFSGGYAQGSQNGTFRTPISITYLKDTLYVLDFISGQITAFKETNYGKLYKKANCLTIRGNYEEAKPIWKEIIKMDSNNQRAAEGLGKAFLQEKNYNMAMKYSKIGLDQQTYSLAYKIVQKQFMSRNFWWIFIIGLTLFSAVCYVLIVSKRRKLITINNLKVETVLNSPFHPIKSFHNIKYKNADSFIIAGIIIAIFYLFRVSSDLFGGFMYVITNESTYNALYTLFGTVGICLLWIISNWLVGALTEGKGNFKQIFTVTAYSLIPLIFYSFIFILLSHVIVNEGNSVFIIIQIIIDIYTFIMLMIGMSVIHEFSFFKSLWTSLITVVFMFIVAFVIFVLFTLSQQFIGFIISVIREIIYR